MRHHISRFVKKNAVMVIALFAAVITTFFVPVDKKYIDYFDFKTLTCLFCVLATVCALKDEDFFYILAEKIVSKFGNIRLCVLALVYITFIGSMLIANDMALLTFLPLGYFVLSATGKKKHMAFTFIMQNIAANLGGMLTPFGNPQNLFLYTKFNISNAEFIKIMGFPFLAAVFLITLCCIIFVNPEPFEIKHTKKTPSKKTALYLALFAYSIIIIFRFIPYWTGLIVVPSVLLITDRKALKEVDYPLLLTFVFFFIFAGNIGRIDAAKELLSKILEKDTLIASVVSCQFISNVPSAIILSQFTGNYKELLIGVNIGGAGTLIASLASLITFREYINDNPGKKLNYIVMFSAFNFGFLILLTAFVKLILI